MTRLLALTFILTLSIVSKGQLCGSEVIEQQMP